MRMFSIFLSLSLAVFTACGGGSSNKGGASAGAASPEALGKALAESFGNATKFKALLPTDAAINAVMKCEGTNKMLEGINELRSEVDKEFASMKDIKVEFVSAKTKDVKKVPAGEKNGPCEATKEFEIAKIKVKMKMTKDGQTKEDGEGFKGIKLDGKWYIIDL